MIGWSPLGDRAYLAKFATEVEAQRWAEAVRSRGWAGVDEVTVAYASAAVFFDPGRTDPVRLEGRLRGVAAGTMAEAPGQLIRVPVLYDGPDLTEVASRVGLTTDGVIAAHSGRDYAVFALGFQPGFPYAGYLPEALAGLGRLATPRLRVPAGAVAIAGRQTGIYPAETPGGWLLLGRTPARVVDLDRGVFPIRVGDRLWFEPIDHDTFRARAGEDLATTDPG